LTTSGDSNTLAIVNSGESPLTADRITEIPTGFSAQSPTPTPVIISPNNPPWGTLAAFLTWLASVALLLFVPVITALPYLIYRATAGLPIDDSMRTDKNFIFFSVLGVIPAHLLTFLIAWLVVTRAGRYPFWKTVGWDWPGHFGVWKSVGIAVSLLAVGVLVTYFFGGPKTELEEIINSSYRTRVVTAILAATTGPLVEEVIYRGVIYAALQRLIGVVWTVLVVSMLFAGVHVYQYRSNIWVIAVICLLSVTLTLVRAYSGRLLPPFIIHFVFNGIQSVLLVVQPFFEKTEQPVPEPIPAQVTAIVFRYLT
jgi:membrane protease YdiL (CAAX protease family)